MAVYLIASITKNYTHNLIDKQKTGELINNHYKVNIFKGSLNIVERLQKQPTTVKVNQRYIQMYQTDDNII